MKLCQSVGLTQPDLVKWLKMKDRAGWNGTRDSAPLRLMIAGLEQPLPGSNTEEAIEELDSEGRPIKAPF